jgi:hypothetical protein
MIPSDPRDEGVAPVTGRGCVLVIITVLILISILIWFW